MSIDLPPDTEEFERQMIEPMLARLAQELGCDIQAPVRVPWWEPLPADLVTAKQEDPLPPSLRLPSGNDGGSTRVRLQLTALLSERHPRSSAVSTLRVLWRREQWEAAYEIWRLLEAQHYLQAILPTHVLVGMHTPMTLGALILRLVATHGPDNGIPLALAHSGVIPVFQEPAVQTLLTTTIASLAAHAPTALLAQLLQQYQVTLIAHLTRSHAHVGSYVSSCVEGYFPALKAINPTRYQACERGAMDAYVLTRIAAAAAVAGRAAAEPGSDEDRVAPRKRRAGMCGATPDLPAPLHTDWGRMRIQSPPRQFPRKATYMARRWLSTDRGTRLRRIHRICTDRKVFGYKKPEYGGTILIDCSGSTFLSPEMIHALVHALPDAQIALYSGARTTGILRIVADRGRITDDRLLDRPSAPGNVIDGPALEWLGRQRGPRIWISDEAVTGKFDARAAELTRQAHDLVRWGRIHRVWPPAAITKVVSVRPRMRRLLEAVLAERPYAQEPGNRLPKHVLDLPLSELGQRTTSTWYRSRR
jgi:hypothetical protein